MVWPCFLSQPRLENLYCSTGYLGHEFWCLLYIKFRKSWPCNIQTFQSGSQQIFSTEEGYSWKVSICIFTHVNCSNNYCSVKVIKLKWKQYYQFYNTVTQSLTAISDTSCFRHRHQTTTKLNHQPSRDFVENSAGIWTRWYAFNSLAKINMLCRLSARCRVRHIKLSTLYKLSIFKMVLPIYTTLDYINSTNKSSQTCFINL